MTTSCDTATTTEATRPDTGDDSFAPAESSSATRGIRAIATWSPLRRRLIVAALATVVVCGGATATVLGVRIHHHNQVAAARAEAVDAAKHSAATVLTYHHDNVDADLAAAAGLLTGAFEQDFATLAQQAIIPAAKQGAVSTEATVADIAVISGDNGSVSLLAFVNQQTTSASMPEPQLSGSRVKIQMTRTDDGWRIAGITPV